MDPGVGVLSLVVLVTVSRTTEKKAAVKGAASPETVFGRGAVEVAM
jgi:hypothetical protein